MPKLAALSASLSLVGGALLATPATADIWYCRPKLPPAEFNFDGGHLNMFNTVKPADASHIGKLAFTVVMRNSDEFSLRFQKTGHSRDVNGCGGGVLVGNTRNKDASYLTRVYFMDFPEGEYDNDEIFVDDGKFRQWTKASIHFTVSAGRVTYLGSYNISYDPHPLENRLFHYSMGSSGWRMELRDEWARDSKLVDPGDAYEAVMDNQAPIRDMQKVRMPPNPTAP